MILKQKSKFNADASELLIRETLFAPSVHCSYYSSFQKMKVAVKHFIGISYDDIDKNVQASKRLSEHAYIRTKILNLIYENDKNEYGEMGRRIKDLFNYRINSDYKDIEINRESAVQAQKYSKEIVSYLEEKLHV